MTQEFEKLTGRYEKEKDPEEKQKLKKELDQMPMSTGELDQVQQREADRKAADIEAYRQQRKQ